MDLAAVLNERNGGRLEAVEMSCLRSIAGVSRMDRVRSVEVRRNCGLEQSLVVLIMTTVLS